MDNGKRDQKNSAAKIMQKVVMFSYFSVCGVILGWLLNTVFPKEVLTSGKLFLVLVLLLGVLYIILFIQLCLHEVGHMVFGLLSGYSFQSIRFGSLMFYKSESGIKTGRYSLAGTGGQCLMIPPELPVGDVPTRLYNWGGVIANAAATMVSAIVLAFSGSHPYLKLVSVLTVMVGLFFVIINGIPVEAWSNDGYNAVALDKDLKAKNAFLISFRIIGKIQDGVSPKDLPEEWMEWSYEDGDTALTSGIGVQRLCWLINNQRFDEAYELADYIDKNVSSLVLIHQMLVKCERIFCMIMTGKDSGEIRKEYETRKNDFLSLRQIPTTQRILYAYYKLIEKNSAEAEKAQSVFEQLAARYPYPSETSAERELFKAVDEKAENE